jgi:hypothetical protein
MACGPARAITAGALAWWVHLPCEQGRKTLAVVVTAGQRGHSRPCGRYRPSRSSQAEWFDPGGFTGSSLVLMQL